MKTWLISFLILILTLEAFSESSGKSIPKKSYLKKFNPEKFEKLQAPEWLRRFDLMWNIQRNLHTTWSLETIQPLYRTPDSWRNTIFFQGRAGYREHNTTFNLGLGYRYLTVDETAMVGFNSFYDVTSKYKHQRFGAGTEVFCGYATVRGNFYKNLTPTKTVKKEGSEITTERVLSGWNVECEIPFPFLPWIRMTADYYFWDGHHIKDEKGYHVSCIMDLCNYLTLEMGIDQSNYQKNNNFVLLTFHPGRPKRIEYTLFNKPYSKKMFVARSVKMRTLEKVRREQNVVAAKRKKGSGIVTISRGT